MLRHGRARLKTKVIIGASTLVAILTALSMVTFLMLRSHLHSLSSMIDQTILTNDIRKISGSVTEGLPAEIEDYSLHPNENKKAEILNQLEKIRKSLEILKTAAAGTDRQVGLELVTNMLQTYFDSFNKIDQALKDKADFGQINALIVDVKESSPLVSEGIQQLISMELSADGEAKAILSRKADSDGVVLLIAIANVSVFGFILFYLLILKRSILIPLNKMGETMRHIAKSGDDLSLRVQVSGNDEIGELAKHFNSMADTVENYKNNLEHLVETRTQQLQSTQALLVESAKLSALGEMAGGVAHEINTPLAAIQLIAGSMRKQLLEPQINVEKAVAATERIELIVNRIAKIVKGLKSFSRSGSKDAVAVSSLTGIVEDAISLCSEKFRNHGIELRWKKPLEDFGIPCRSVEIGQVLLNLLNNAHDAVEELPEKWVEISARILDNEVEIRITDSGRGIPANVQEKMFQPFFTTKEIGKGTGLGLSISRGIVEAHAGRFGLDSSSANTCFVIRIPLSHTLAA